MFAMSTHIQYKIKMQCSNDDCSHVFEYYDTIFPLVNDPGWVIVKCPDCGALTKGVVKNVDIFEQRIGFGDVVGAVEFDDEYATHEYDDVATGEMKVVADEAVNEVAKPKNIAIWEIGGRDYDAECRKVVAEWMPELERRFNCIYQNYLAGNAGADDINRLLLKVNLPAAVGGGYGLYMKEIRSEHDFSLDGLTLVGVRNVAINRMVDGIHTRDYCFAVLDNMLRRWRLMCREVVFVSPFIGLQYHNEKCEAEVRRFWNWLGEVLDLKKSRFITRAASLSMLKKALDHVDGQSFEDMKKWDDLNNLIAAADGYDGRKKGAKDGAVILYHKSHAKFYAGVFDDGVEVMMGSYNLHSGGYLENLTLSRYDRSEFERMFLAPFGIGLRGVDEEYIHAAGMEVDESGVSPIRLLDDKVYKDWVDGVRE